MGNGVSQLQSWCENRSHKMLTHVLEWRQKAVDEKWYGLETDVWKEAKGECKTNFQK